MYLSWIQDILFFPKECSYTPAMNRDTCIEELKIHVQNSWTNKESILRVKGRISFTGTYSPIIVNNI